MTGRPAFPRPGSATASQTAPTTPMKPTPFVSLPFHPLLTSVKVCYVPVKAGFIIVYVRYTLSTHQSLTFLMLKEIKWRVTNESLLDDGNPVIGRVTDTHQIKN